MPEAVIRYGDLDLLNRHAARLLGGPSVTRIELEDVDDVQPREATLALRIWYDDPSDDVIAAVESEARVAFERHVQQLLVAQAVTSPEGRARLAQAMIEPLRNRRNYAGLARQIVQVDPMPGGAVPAYLAGPRAHQERPRGRPAPHRNHLELYEGLLMVFYAPDEADTYGPVQRDWGWWDGGLWNGESCPAGYWVYEAPWWYVWRRQVRQRGQVDPNTRPHIMAPPPERVGLAPEGRRVTMPMFELSSSPSIPIGDIRSRRFNLIERVQDGMRASFGLPLRRGTYSNKPMGEWGSKHRYTAPPFGPGDQTWPEWVEPGAQMRSTNPQYPGVAWVIEVHDDFLVLNWNSEIVKWVKQAAWFHDEWQHEEAPPSIWDRLNAA